METDDKGIQFSERCVTVRTSLGTYPVMIGRNLNPGEIIRNNHKVCHILMVSDDIVFGLYGQQKVRELEDCGFTVDSFVITHGEKSKCLDVAGEILEYAGKIQLTRSDLMVALGGGVVGDLTGFCASVYLRGMDFVQIPTTLLAAVDSSVGGKTAVDLSCGKNLAGAFHQPICVCLDVNMFDTLPAETFAEGMAEAIKYGLILDRELYETFLNGNYNMEDICQRCIQLKADVVEVDEFDNGLRKILNFGHTPAHGMENLSGYTFSHGNAVAVGMVIMTRVSECRGMIPKGSADILEKLLLREGLPVTTQYTPEALSRASMGDKKRAGGTISIILLEKIGKAAIVPVPVEALKEIYETGMSK